MLLSISAAVFGWLFQFGRAFAVTPDQIFTFVILLVPMISCGIALLVERPEEDDQE